MSENTVVRTNETEAASSLPERLDTAISEASSGIGVMMSALVRRSLHSGVADIERTLEAVTAEKVDLAIEMEMPGVSEAAHRVAETTSMRVVTSAVAEAEQRSQQELKAAVTHIEGAIKQTTDEGRDGAAKAASEIAELEARAQSSWKKLKTHFAAVDSELQKTKSRISELSAAHSETKSHLAEVVTENVHLKTQLSELSQRVDGLSTSTESELTAVVEHNQQLRNRLEELEKPRGLKGVWQKLRPGKKKSPAIEGPDEIS